MSKTVIVIGAGPAGMMAAGTAARAGCRVKLIEKNPIIGKKLLITGKGRCNVTNFCDVDNVLDNITSSNPRFMYSALNSFNCYDTYAFFEGLGVALKTERGNRVFPQSDRAADIRNALLRFVRDSGAELVCDNVKALETDPLRVVTQSSQYTADAVIVATGGLSYPATGSTGDGYRFARSTAHNIIKTQPALVALAGSVDTCRALAGLSLKNVSVCFFDDSAKPVYEDFGEMIFTHTGVSGPVILSASAVLDFLKHKEYTLSIDLKPALNEKELDSRILRDFEKYTNKDFVNSLSDLLPSKIIPVIIERSCIDPRQKVNTITKMQRKTLARVIKSFRLTMTGKAGYDEAIITSGGVDTADINPKTMESLRVRGLYFAGEVLDVSANTGGYNLQIAFSSGYLAGKSCSGGKNGI